MIHYFPIIVLYTSLTDTCVPLRRPSHSHIGMTHYVMER